MENDLISKQAAIDAVNNAFDRETLLDGFVRSIAVRAIRDMPSAQPDPQWIPCSEPPKESGTYIVTAYDGTNKRVSFVKYQKTLKRWDLTGTRAYWRILAYKPMPEPYKEEQE